MPKSVPFANMLSAFFFCDFTVNSLSSAKIRIWPQSEEETELHRNWTDASKWMVNWYRCWLEASQQMRAQLC